MNPRARRLLAAFLLAFPAGAGAMKPGLRVDEVRSARRPFAWESTRAAADFARASGGMMVDGGPQGITVGVIGLIISAPLILLSPLGDLVSAPFRKRRFARYEMRLRIMDQLSAPVRDQPVVVEAFGVRVTMEDRYGYEVFRSSTAARTDAEGWFEASGGGFIGPNADFSLRVRLEDPPRPAAALRVFTRGGSWRAENMGALSDPYRLEPALPDPSDWDD